MTRKPPPLPEDRHARELQFQLDQGYDLALAEAVVWLRTHTGIGSGPEAAAYVEAMRQQRKRRGRRRA